MKTLKIVGIFLIVLAIILGIGYKIIFKPPRVIAEQKAVYELTTSDFIKEFRNDANKASKKFVNKVVLLNGDVSEVNVDGITISNTIYAQFDDKKFNSLIKGNNVKIKGRCVGYDDLLETVKLDQCCIID